MARGGMGRRGGPTLAERSAAARRLTAPDDAEAPGDVDQDRPTSSPRQRHCWVHTPEAPSEPRPGLVIEWRQTATGWQARVVYALDDGDRASTVENWVPAERLRPA
jgi:hypothetical protein